MRDFGVIFNAYVKFEEAMLEHNEVDNNAYSDDDEEQDCDDDGCDRRDLTDHNFMRDAKY